MTTVLTTTGTEAAAPRAEATPGCGCCIPPPDPGSPRELAELQARREVVERRLRRLATTGA